MRAAHAVASNCRHRQKTYPCEGLFYYYYYFASDQMTKKRQQTIGQMTDSNTIQMHSGRPGSTRVDHSKENAM